MMLNRQLYSVYSLPPGALVMRRKGAPVLPDSLFQAVGSSPSEQAWAQRQG